MASFDAMAAEARRLWDGSALRYFFVRNPGDAKSIVQIGRLDEGIVSSTYDAAYFDGPTGALISYRTGHGAGHEHAALPRRAFTSSSSATGACAGSISASASQAAC